MKISLCILLFIATLSTFGRAPAVEPVTGIAIDQYRETDPATDPGFNWNQGKYVQETSLVTTRIPAEAALIENTKNQSKSWPTYVFLFSLLALPFILWFSIMKSLDHSDDHSQPIPQQEELGTTYNLSEERAKRQSDDDQEDKVSKAS